MSRKGTKILIAAVTVALVLLAIPSPANAGGNDLSRARAATARFRDIDRALAAGYGLFKDAKGIACIDSPAGVMGIHYVNGKLVGDAVLDPTTPEALVYQQRPNGELRLVAVEYIVFQGAWLAAGNTSVPTLFGRPLKLIPMGNRYGLPPFYEIHAWIWKHNPSGMFSDWNPRGTCDVPGQRED
jgi:hypothetical protein